MSAPTTLRHSQPFMGEGTSSQPQVSFKPVFNPPSSLGFGFGAATRPPQPGPSMPSFPLPARSPIKPAAGFGFGGPMTTLRAAPSVGGMSRKRRSVSPIEVEMTQAEKAIEGAEDSGRRVKRTLKRLKGVEGDGVKQGTPKQSLTSEVDVGKSLSHLSKPELLSILQSLMSANSALVSQTEQLLPPPSLSSFNSTLSTIEATVLSAIPQGAMRDEYVWSRVKASVESYVSEARYWVSAFCPGSESPRPQQHPSTIFSFLAALTASVLRLESALPRVPLPAFPTSAPMMAGGIQLNPLDPLASSLVPHLFNRWHHLVTRVASDINQHGRMYGHELIRSWLRALEAMLEQPTNAAGRPLLCRVALEGVRVRVVQELGWVAGIKPAVPSMDARMDADDDI